MKRNETRKNYFHPNLGTNNSSRKPQVVLLSKSKLNKFKAFKFWTRFERWRRCTLYPVNATIVWKLIRRNLEKKIRMKSLLVLAAAFNVALAGQYWVQLELPPMPPVIPLPDIPHLFTSGPMRRGTFTLKNAQIIGWDKAKLNFTFDPVNMMLREIFDNPAMELKGDYSANIEHLDENGVGTFLHGNGSFHVKYTDYHILEALHPIKFSLTHRKYQINYPNYSGKVGNIKGQITGLKNAVTGASVSLDELVKMNNSYKKPMFLDTYRAVANAAIRQGVEKEIGQTLLYAFLGTK